MKEVVQHVNLALNGQFSGQANDGTDVLLLRFRHGTGQSVGWGEPIYTAVSLRIREHLERSALCKVHQQRHLVVDVKHLA